MPNERACVCGHIFRPADDAPGRRNIVCPKCGSSLPLEMPQGATGTPPPASRPTPSPQAISERPSAGPLKPLWMLMGRRAGNAQSPEAADTPHADPEPVAADASGDRGTADPDASDPPSVTVDMPPASLKDESPSPDATETPVAPRTGRGLWNLMKGPAVARDAVRADPGEVGPDAASNPQPLAPRSVPPSSGLHAPAAEVPGPAANLSTASTSQEGGPAAPPSHPATPHRGLWALMGGPQRSAAEPSSTALPAPVSPPPTDPPVAENLHSQPVEGSPHTPPPVPPLGPPSAVPAAPRGDPSERPPPAMPASWGISRPLNEVPAAGTAPLELPAGATVGAPAGPGTPGGQATAEAPSAPIIPVSTADHLRRAGQVASGRSRMGLAACLLGFLSVPLSLLAMFPVFWFKIPAMACGFASLVLGFSAAGEIRRSRGRQTGMFLASSGIVTGIFGMLLGPLAFAHLGRWLGSESGRRVTESHLESIGRALNDYHQQKGAFPPGGILKPDADGRPQRMHGWLTLILPYLDHQDVYAAINFDLPYDDPANRAAVSQDIPEFFATGGDRTKVGGEFGATHFAGFGGELLDADEGTLPAGIFGPNSDVTRDRVGNLSQTFAAGEIASNIPTWSEPENWRVIGRGLNRDIDGFGNAAGTGASFLMADGSVRFFSNATDPSILLRLSRRDPTKVAVSAPSESGKLPPASN